MTRYVALLRAINVGGHTVKMDRLRVLFEELDLTRVETFIASGNVLFDARGRATPALEVRIERQLAAALGYPVATFLRPLASLAGIARDNPFDAADGHTVYVGFLKCAPPAEGVRTLMSLESASHAFQVNGSEVYWLSRIRTSDSKISGSTFEKALGGPATFRNMTTVRKLAEKGTA